MASRSGATSDDSGAVFNRIVGSLTGIRAFDLWRSGLIDRNEYTRQLDSVLAVSDLVSLSENECALSARIHWDDSEFVDRTLHACVADNLLESASYDVPAYLRFRDRMETDWDHGGRRTFIFPEEARLLYAIANITRPRHLAVLGSYYGYWAAWAVAGAGAALESAVLVDIDPSVNELAEKNLARFGLNSATVMTADAIGHMKRSIGTVDLIVLDAEGPATARDMRMAGKAIYGPITAAALPHLRVGGALVTHNVLLDHTVRHPYFGALVERNRAVLSEFLTGTAICRAEVQIPSTEGISLHIR